MFGTFKQEEERPTYGVTTPLKSWNPVYANFSHYIYLFKTTSKSRSLKDTLKILFKKPGWQPDYLGGALIPQEPAADYKKYQTEVLPSRSKYVLAHFLILLVLVPVFFFIQKDMDLALRAAYAGWIVMTTLSFSFMFERSANWLWYFEIVRMLALIILAYCVALSLSVNPSIAIGVAAGIGFLSLIYFRLLIFGEKESTRS